MLGVSWKPEAAIFCPQPMWEWDGKRERGRDGNPFQKRPRHPDVKPMPAAAAATMFLDMISGSRIINCVELCHYITAQSLTITTLGKSCHQFVFFSSLSLSPASNENVRRRGEKVEKKPSIASVSAPCARYYPGNMVSIHSFVLEKSFVESVNCPYLLIMHLCCTPGHSSNVCQY